MRTTIDGAPLPTRRRLSRVVVAGALALTLPAAAACQMTGAAAEDARPAPGGTLRVTLASWPQHLDPQQINAAVGVDISRLITRTLTTFRSEPGTAVSEIVPDLATDTGRPSEDNTVWEFTLKGGGRWDDGSPVTCEQVRYGVERSFSQLLTEGPQYPRWYLTDNETPYQGPWSAGEDLDAVECVDQKLIRFHLTQPVGDFGYVVALPVFAPVPLGADELREEYDLQPRSTGPYQVVEHVVVADDPAGNSLVLERNPYWDARTDPVRRAYPDRIEFSLTTNTAETTNDLIDDQGDDKSRILLDADVAANFVQQVMTDPQLSARVATGPIGTVRYLALNTRRLPQVCRRALAFAIDKRKFRSTLGGSLSGDLATSMIPPNMRAHQEFDHYGGKDHPDGQPDRARELLAQAEAEGAPCPDSLTLAHPDQPDIRRPADTVVDSYQKIGIQVTPEVADLGTHSSNVSDLDHAWDIVWSDWAPDWASGSAVIPPLFDGRTLAEPGNHGTANFSLLDDETINQMIDDALAETDLGRQPLLWGELDSRTQEMAATIPMMYMNGMRMMGSNVRGAFIHPQFAMPDLAVIGVSDPDLSESSAE